MSIDVEVRLVAKVGMKVSLFDQDMLQVTEWADLIEGVDYKGNPCLLANFTSPDRIATVVYAVMWDQYAGLMQPQAMDMPVTIHPGSSPIEYRIERNNSPQPIPTSIPMPKLY